MTIHWVYAPIMYGKFFNFLIDFSSVKCYNLSISAGLPVYNIVDLAPVSYGPGVFLHGGSHG